jgi:cytochrome d ubiquinol oxidase subunit II
MTMILFWVTILAVSILLYVLLDGFDLGVGILSGLERDGPSRESMFAAVSPVWDGNETWLISSGVVLWGAFPIVYSTAISALYIPVVLMLGGLILRGVAFEFRHNADRTRWIWDVSFCLGSTLASFMQGVMVGALVSGLPIIDGRYIGGALFWLNPFAILCGVGLCCGYALLGAGWLVLKCGGLLRERAFRQVSYLAGGLLLFLIVVLGFAVVEHFAVMNRWLERPYLFVFPGIGACAGLALAASLYQHRHDHWPFLTVVVIFAAAFGTLAISFWPYMVPFAITIDQAAAPASSLNFMFWAGVVVFPLMLLYTAINYIVFRGKTVAAKHSY